MPIDIEAEAAIAIAGALIGGIIVVFAQWFRQWFVDNCSEWPFDANPRGVKPPLEGGNAYQVRVRIFNRASTQAYVNPEPKNAAGQSVGDWKIRNP